MMKIYIIRHGETKKNKEKRLQGRSDSPLNEKGKQECRQVRDFFKGQGIIFDKVYSSPLQRAADTARIITDGQIEIHLDDRLLEMDYGSYEGSSLENPSPEIIHFFSDFVHNPAPEGMESLKHVTNRLGEFLNEIGLDSPENILITTHAIAMKGALEYLTPESKGAYWSKYIGNCAVYTAEYSNGKYNVPEETFSLKYEPGV